MRKGYGDKAEKIYIGGNPMKRIRLFLKRHASTILSVVASLGVVGTGVLSAKATYDAVKKIEKEQPKTKRKTLITVLPFYILPASIGVSTIGCVIGSNIINQRQIAGLAGAVSLVQKSFSEYKKKLIELHGKEADTEVATKIASEKFPEKKISEGKTLFYDRLTNRYFESTMEDVMYALYNLNKLFQFEGIVSVNDYCKILGIKPMGDDGDLEGWRIWEMGEFGLIPWINAEPMLCTTCDGQEYYMLDFEQGPFVLYDLSDDGV